jgi:DNA-binding XRE family transcriptional regulator
MADSALRLASRIRELRTSEGLTQEEFGKIFGIVKSTVSLYESAKSSPNDELKEQICDYFKISLDYLYGRSDNKTETYGNLNYAASLTGGYDNKIRYWIEKTGESYNEIAKQLDITVEQLMNYMDEKVAIPYHILSKLSDICEVSTDCLLGLNNKSRGLNSDNVLPFQYNYQIAERIIELRNPVTDTDSFLCTLLCISEKELFYLIEYGFIPHVDVIIKLSEYFNVSTDYLLCRIDKQSEKMFSTFKKLSEDNRDILIGKSKELLQNQRYDSSVAADESESKTGTYNQAK